jgi:spermidine/putrescine transport system permease protein
MGRRAGRLLCGGGLMRSSARIGFILLLTPLVLWLGLLIIIPHIDMLLISLRERISFGVYEPSTTHYMNALTEPL